VPARAHVDLRAFLVGSDIPDSTHFCQHPVLIRTHAAGRGQESFMYPIPIRFHSPDQGRSACLLSPPTTGMTCSHLASNRL